MLLRYGFTLCILLLSSFAFAQKGYIIQDSVLTSGVSIRERMASDNAHFIEVIMPNKTVVTFVPKELKEWGFTNGRVFVSRLITLDGSERRVFLERLAQGKISLYHYTGRDVKAFFIEKEGQLQEFSKEGALPYQQLLRQLTADCPAAAQALPHVRFSKKSLTAFLQQYNSCSIQPLPRTKIGLQAGYSLTKLYLPKGPAYSSQLLQFEQQTTVVNTLLPKVDFTPAQAIVGGIGLDIPLPKSRFSLATGLLYSQRSYAVNSITLYSDMDVLLHLRTLELPLMLRYTLPSPQWRPFVNLGGTLAYHLENTTAVYTSVINASSIDILKPLTEPFITKTGMGLTVGTGVWRPLSPKHTLSAELRYTHQPRREQSAALRGLALLLSIYF